MQAPSIAEIKALQQYLTPQEQAELEVLLATDELESPWRPLPGPQTTAYNSQADVIGYGGAAGGGKSHLALGMALTKHRKVQIVRREGPQLAGLLEDLVQITGKPDNLTGNPRTYRDGDLRIAFNSIPNAGDEAKYQGIPKDLLVIDEAANCLESQVRFLMGWVRSTVPGQACRTLLTFNPPTTAEGRWVVDFFGPWIDKRHAMHPAAPGDLRYVYTDPETGGDVWLWPHEDPSPFVLGEDGQRLHDYPADTDPERVIRPKSRTFIPSRISDNPFLMNTNYIATLQALPEPLRSQMLDGDFTAGMKDDAFQVIPTAWVDAAMERWKDQRPRREMMQVGVDIARGGDDTTTIFCRYAGNWYAPPIVLPGTDTPDGPTAAAAIINAVRDRAPVNIDVIGVGASPYDILKDHPRFPVYAIDVRNRPTATDKSGKLHFFNLRSQLWWQLREALDPANDTGICLPVSKRLAKELTAPRFEMRGIKVFVEGRKQLIKRIGFSPDMASALALASITTLKIEALDRSTARSTVLDYDPYATM